MAGHTLHEYCKILLAVWAGSPYVMPFAVFEHIEIHPFDAGKRHMIHTHIVHHGPFDTHIGAVGVEPDCQPCTVGPQVQQLGPQLSLELLRNPAVFDSGLVEPFTDKHQLVDIGELHLFLFLCICSTLKHQAGQNQHQYPSNPIDSFHTILNIKFYPFYLDSFAFHSPEPCHLPFGKLVDGNCQ
ncbi:hypothetical protein SDC9_117692 [bioreactor metagenome]|uniref:Uncharacterized protein n=1 Tax=bioreactor metagenome TaxID=1076179 RepID=A0A645BZF9_9ZZZZ